MKPSKIFPLPLRATIAGLVAGSLVSLAGAKPSQTSPLRVEAVISAPLAQVWQAWSTSDGASAFLAPRVVVDPRVGGRFEVYFDPHDPAKSSRGRVLGFVPGQSLSFEWHLPPMYPDLQNVVMPVTVTFRADGPTRTVVTIEHAGWGTGPHWDDAFTHMHRGWSDLLGRLQERFTAGPIDWTREMAQGPDRENFTLKERSATHS